MENKNVFQFKQFSVAHHHCAMKVGADAVLLGAWATIPPNSKTVLDVGTGSGVIALMLAQRTPNDTQIWGIEIDPAAAAQAQQNAAESPWKHRVRVVSGNFTQYQHLQISENLPSFFDLIVSNPPYFEQHLPATGKTRNQARHTDHLTYQQLAQGAGKYLNPDGCFCLILPHPQALTFIQIAETHKLYCHKITAIHTLAHKPAKRWLMQFGKFPPHQTLHNNLVMGGAHPTRFTPECKQLTQDFYAVL
ncbi:MAG TPA: methyltransferase [Chitinophagales bacterium]|nr:methyltransferase [Chitinophagales bacterium]